MKKQNVIAFFKAGHDEFRQTLDMLSSEQIEKIPSVGIWPVKNVIAHISAWNWEQIKEIDRTLQGKHTWNRLNDDEISNTALFNSKAIEKRKDWTITRLMKEWEDSFNTLIQRIYDLNDDEWKQGGMDAIFKYELNGGSDESRHAKEIKKRFAI